MPAIDALECAEVVRLLDDYLDRELSPGQMRLLEKHLEVCAVCAAEARFEDSVLREMREKLQRISVPPGLEARVRRALARARLGEDNDRPARE